MGFELDTLRNHKILVLVDNITDNVFKVESWRQIHTFVRNGFINEEDEFEMLDELFDLNYGEWRTQDD